VSWQWVLTNSAERDLRKLNRAVRRRIFDALDRFAEDPGRGDVRKLAGTDDEWRLRVGPWPVRYRFDTEAQTVVVTRVIDRKEAYRD
jgi:mRNA interferase RelE/StbE